MIRDRKTKTSNIGSRRAWPMRDRLDTLACWAISRACALGNLEQDDHSEDGRGDGVTQEEQQVVVVGEQTGEDWGKRRAEVDRPVDVAETPGCAARRVRDRRWRR